MTNVWKRGSSDYKVSREVPVCSFFSPKIPHSTYFKYMFKLWAVGLERPRSAAPHLWFMHHAQGPGQRHLPLLPRPPGRHRAKTTEGSHFTSKP